ncbi:hypothetical protein LCGC14_2156720, partial [marine sediment metagenome]
MLRRMPGSWKGTRRKFHSSLIVLNQSYNKQEDNENEKHADRC